MKRSLFKSLVALTAGMTHYIGGPRERAGNGSLPSRPRWGGPPTYHVAFTARSGRTIVRETQVGSSHERRLLKRRGARRVS